MKFLQAQNRIYLMLFSLINVLLSLLLSSCSSLSTQTAKSKAQKIDMKEWKKINEILFDLLGLGGTYRSILVAFS